MALNTPTTKEISDNIVSQIQASLNQTIPLLPKAFIRVLAKALAGVFVLLYKFGGFIFLQMFIRTASVQETTINGKTFSPLLEWGRQVGVGDPTSSTNAQLEIEINVENQTGFLDANTQLLGNTNGVTYITLTSIALNGATVTATVKAVSDQQGGSGAGVIGNLSNGEILSFANPIANVSRETTVTSQIVTGANEEDTEVYRQRVLDRWQKPPQGGAYSDYEIWGEEVEGIVNVYPYTSDCPGQVDVYVEATEASSGNEDGIPTTAQLQAVLDSINFNESGLASRRPATALVNTFAITRVPFDVRVVGLSGEDISQLQTDITNAIKEYFLSREPYIEGLSIPPRKDRITKASVGGTIVDITNANDAIFTNVFITVNAVQTEFYVLETGEKAKPGTVTFL